MIQYEVYKTPSSKEEEPDHYHARAVSKGVITYDQLKKNLEYASSSTPGDVSECCVAENILHSRKKVRATAASMFPRLGVSKRVRTRPIPSDEIIGRYEKAGDPRFITH